jgi:hypothetical protein
LAWRYFIDDNFGRLDGIKERTGDNLVTTLMVVIVSDNDYAVVANDSVVT